MASAGALASRKDVASPGLAIHALLRKMLFLPVKFHSSRTPASVMVAWHGTGVSVGSIGSGAAVPPNAASSASAAKPAALTGELSKLHSQVIPGRMSSTEK